MCTDPVIHLISIIRMKMLKFITFRALLARWFRVIKYKWLLLITIKTAIVYKSKV